MNREILFRGLKADGSNEWVYGYYRKWFNSSDGKEVHIISNDYGEGSLVIPSTVGQFTGLTDKTGTRIFEGDYVSTDLQRPYNEIIYKNGAFMFECYDENLYHDIFYPVSDLEKKYLAIW